MFSLYKKFNDWLDKRYKNEINRRHKLLEILGRNIGYELNKITNKCEELSKDLKDGEFDSILRFTITINTGFKFGRKELKLVLNGDEFAEPFHDVDMYYAYTMWYGVNKFFIDEGKYDIIKHYGLRRFGIVRSEESIEDGSQFMFYIEIFKVDVIKNILLNKCLDAFYNSNMINSINWNNTPSGTAISIPVPSFNFDVSKFISKYDFKCEICSKVNAKLKDELNNSGILEDGKEFVVSCEVRKHINYNVTIEIKLA